MDWKFFFSQLIAAISTIVAAIIAAMIVLRYQKLGSFGVNQRIKDRLIAISLGILAALSIAVPLWSCIRIVYSIYFYIAKSPDSPVTRSDTLLISAWVFYFHVFLIQTVYNSRHVLKSHKESQRAKREREFRARQEEELKPLDDALKKLNETLDKTRKPKIETKSPPPDSKP